MFWQQTRLMRTWYCRWFECTAVPSRHIAVLRQGFAFNSFMSCPFLTWLGCCAARTACYALYAPRHVFPTIQPPEIEAGVGPQGPQASCWAAAAAAPCGPASLWPASSAQVAPCSSAPHGYPFHAMMMQGPEGRASRPLRHPWDCTGSWDGWQRGHQLV